MVHPVGLGSKTTHSLLDIAESIRDLLFREYNKDAKYRDAGLMPFRGRYLGRQGAPIVVKPALSVAFGAVLYEDAPQDAGADVDAEVKIFLFGTEKTSGAQFVEAVRMVEAARHIIIDNPTMPTKEGSEQVFQLGYGQMRAEFTEEVFKNFSGEVVGCEVGIITARAVFAEKGY